MTTMNKKTLYTLSETAQVLGVHYETAARWVRAGKLAGVKLSRRKVVVPKENLDAFLSAESPAPAKDKPPPLGSPQRWMSLIGTLTAKEAERLMASVDDFEKVETGD